MLEIADVLKDLTQTPSPAGFESGVAEKAKKWLSGFTEKVEIDRLGNVLGYLPCGKENASTVLLDAHIDEVGIMVTANEEGYALFRSIGGIDSHILPAQTVMLLTDPPVYGVIACLPPHVQTQSEMEKVSPLNELYIDTGGIEVPVGTIGVYVSEGFKLGEKQYCSKSLDDRVCFAAILRTLELLPAVEAFRGRKRSVNIAVVGSVQEETGGRGIKTAAYAINPKYGIAIDVTFGKSPDSTDGSYVMGGGPCICIGPECNRKITDKLTAIAKEHKIPYQIEVLPRYSGTNGTDLMISRAGVASSVVGIPLKYMHTPVETVHFEDIENTARLLAEWIVALED